jgi:hypothetical protein
VKWFSGRAIAEDGRSGRDGFVRLQANEW